MPGARKWILVPLALVITAGLAGITTWVRADGIESDLTTRSHTALEAAGLTGGDVSFTGRDARLTGFPEGKAQEAGDAVRAVNGVGSVVVIPAAAPAPAGSSEPAPSNSPAPPPPTTSAPPADPKAALQEEINNLLQQEPITFIPDSGHLTAQGVKVTGEVADLIKKARQANADLRFEIGGHVAAGPGDPATALQLSQDRARAVAQLLAKQGVPANRITAKGFGDRQPSTTGGDDRRVEITVR